VPSPLTNTMNANNNNKKEEMEFVLAMGMVAYTVVKQLDCKKKRDDRKKKMNRARPNMRGGPRAIYPHQRALDAIYTDFLDQAALYGPTFQSYFWLSRPRVQLLMEVLAGSGD
jgi:hypothetical protein